MELKNSENENTLQNNETTEKSGGLRLAGGDHEDLISKKSIGEIDAWDFSKEIEEPWVKPADSMLKREAKKEKGIGVGAILLRLFQIITWIAVAVEIGAFVYVGMNEGYQLLQSLDKVSLIFKIVAGILLADAVLVNAISGFNIVLIVVAIVLPFLYPAIRNSYVYKSRGLGAAVSVVYFLSIVCFAGYCVNAYHLYGNIIAIENPDEQEKVIATYNKNLPTGQSLGDVLMDEFDIEKVYVVEGEKNNYDVVFEGKGKIQLVEDSFQASLGNGVPTKLIFSYDMRGNLYLKEVTLKNIELTEEGVKNYWEFFLRS